MSVCLCIFIYSTHWLLNHSITNYTTFENNINLSYKLHVIVMYVQVEELQREKSLILNGKMPVEDAPVELANHPVFKIALETNKTLKKKREMVMNV